MIIWFIDADYLIIHLIIKEGVRPTQLLGFTHDQHRTSQLSENLAKCILANWQLVPAATVWFEGNEKFAFVIKLKYLPHCFNTEKFIHIQIYTSAKGQNHFIYLQRNLELNSSCNSLEMTIILTLGWYSGFSIWKVAFIASGYIQAW